MSETTTTVGFVYSIVPMETEMGAWGYGVRQDDFVCDVMGVFDDLLKEGNSISAATRELQSRYLNEIQGTEEEPLFWLALADRQWTYGGLEPQVLRRVEQDLATGRDLERWSEDAKGLARRRKEVEKFILKVSLPNPRPKKPPKVVVRSPKFAVGDCLSIRMAEGQMAAALVLAADHSDVEYGRNLIGVLDYLSLEKPTRAIFQERKWLIRTHNNWKGELDLGWYLPLGYRAVKDRIEVVYQVEVTESDPKESLSYCGWASLGTQVVLQRQWDAKDEDPAN